MNKIFFIIFAAVLMLSPLKVDAQDKDRSSRNFDKESFLIKRSAFIIAELGLTPEEAEIFIPLCEELQQKKFEVGHKCRKLSREMKSNKNPTDPDYTEVIDECLNVGLKEAQLEQEYYERFKEILSPSKLYKLRDAEQKFMHNYMKEVREKRKENKNR